MAVPSRKTVLRELAADEGVRDMLRSTGASPEVPQPAESPLNFLNHALDTEILQ